MLAFRRTFYVESMADAETDVPDLFQAVNESLRETLTALLPDEWRKPLTEQWPTVPKEERSGAPGLEVSLWEPVKGEAPRLLELTVEWEKWRIELAVGQSGDGPIIVYEKAHWLGPGREIPLRDYPELVRFLRPFRARNIEGYQPKVIPLRREKVQNFIDFLQSPERQLPVVFYATQRRTPDCKQPEAADVQDKLQGLAYVVEAQDRDTVEHFNRRLSSHPAYSGAIRVYMPRFQPSDSSRHHPFWPCKAADRAFHEILSDVAQESIRSGLSDDIASLRKRRLEFQHSEVFRLRQEAFRSHKERANAQELEELLQEADSEIAQLQEEKKQLEADVAALRDENRKLSWRLNRQWDFHDEAQEESESGPVLLLSQKAWEQFKAMAPDEQRYWGKHTLPKLLKQELRASQSELISGSKGGPTRVYPRGRTNDGRRVIYYENGEEVRVCEIFTTNEHDKYNRLRIKGPDRDEHTDFKPFAVNDGEEES